jgi:hypothetical protein
MKLIRKANDLFPSDSGALRDLLDLFSAFLLRLVGSLVCIAVHDILSRCVAALHIVIVF